MRAYYKNIQHDIKNKTILCIVEEIIFISKRSNKIVLAKIEGDINLDYGIIKISMLQCYQKETRQLNELKSKDIKRIEQ